ncbi:MAG: serine acetyltransferase [Saprospiraceae bacterium]
MKHQSFSTILLQKHKTTDVIPHSKVMYKWVLELREILFPEICEKRYQTEDEIVAKLNVLKLELKDILSHCAHCSPSKCDDVVNNFMETLPQIYATLQQDLDAFFIGDPAAKSKYEIVRTYPGFFAIYMHRIAHLINLFDVPLIPRIFSEYAHYKTGIDIHPGALIGKYFFIDHGTGVVIGESTIIGDHVKIYQGVTLGALSVEKSLAGIKRHPTVGDHTVIYSGATILGGGTIIGHNCTIGGNVWLTNSVPDGTKVIHKADNTFALKELNKQHE